MSATKKTRPDSIMRSLPVPRQERIIEYLEVASIEEVVKRQHKDGTTAEFTRLRCPTLLEAQQWLAKDGIVTSTGALSNWRSWFLLQRSLEATEASSLKLVAEYKEQGWLKTAEDERLAGQIFFNRLALAEQDAKKWAMVQRATKEAGQLRLDTEKHQRETCELFLKWFTDKRARDIAESNISNADKIQRLRQTYFADVEEFARTDRTEIPQ